MAVVGGGGGPKLHNGRSTTTTTTNPSTKVVVSSTKALLVMAFALMSVYVAILYHQMMWSRDHDHGSIDREQDSILPSGTSSRISRDGSIRSKGHRTTAVKGNKQQQLQLQLSKAKQKGQSAAVKKKKTSWKKSTITTAKKSPQKATTTTTTSTETNDEPPPNNNNHQNDSDNNHNNQNHNQQQEAEYVSACLLVMDDNHFLIEWLAYHYHVLPLRYLIVAVDPRSQTSPSPILDRYRRHAATLNLTIVEWQDEDFMTHSVDQYIIKRPDDQHNRILLQHRARQRMFFYRCLQTIQEQHQQQSSSSSSSAWTLLADTDEYVVLNQHVIQAKYHPSNSSTSTTTTATHIPTIQEPGSVLRMLQLEQQQQQPTAQSDQQPQQGEDQNEPDEGDDKEANDEDDTDTALDLTNSSASYSPVPPCFQIPRLRFGIRESPLARQRHLVAPAWINASNFLTLRWRYHAKRGNVRLNKISKSLIDLTRIPRSAIQPVTSVHRPIRAYCTQRQLHRANRDSVLVIHHYLGTWEQYNFRSDAREGEFMRGANVYRKATKAQALENDDARPWLKGFIDSVGETIAKELLQDVGYVPPKRNGTTAGTDTTPSDQDQDHRPQQQQQDQDKGSRKLEEKCALLFFGLPRAYKNLVLPSIIQNVLWPNARHNCDVFVHYFYLTEEPKGRMNKGGSIDPEAIRLLEGAVHAVAKNYSSTTSAVPATRLPHVDFMYDTEEAFWVERNESIQKYRTTKDKNGRYLYFPWSARSYLYPSSLDNIVRQWHSIESVWELMERAMHQGLANYTQVAVLRSDVLFATPFDIYQTSWLEKEEDRAGRYAVTAPFGLMPVNDRLIYGPYAAIKIWATKRFEYIEHHVRHYPEPGYGMHSERFLESSIFTAMVNQTGVEIVNNPDICFFRTRADESAMISDCELGGETRGIAKVDKTALVKKITGLDKCEAYKMGRQFRALRCLKN